MLFMAMIHLNRGIFLVSYLDDIQRYLAEFENLKTFSKIGDSHISNLTVSKIKKNLQINETWHSSLMLSYDCCYLAFR